MENPCTPTTNFNSDMYSISIYKQIYTPHLQGVEIVLPETSGRFRHGINWVLPKHRKRVESLMANQGPLTSKFHWGFTHEQFPGLNGNPQTYPPFPCEQRSKPLRHSIMIGKIGILEIIPHIPINNQFFLHCSCFFWFLFHRCFFFPAKFTWTGLKVPGGLEDGVWFSRGGHEFTHWREWWFHWWVKSIRKTQFHYLPIEF